MSQSQQFDLDINLILSQKVNLSAVERRCESIIKRRSVKKKSQVEWLLNTIEFMDLTTLAGDDTPGRVSRLCHKALNPVRKDILNDLGISDHISAAAVCVYPNLVKEDLINFKVGELLRLFHWFKISASDTSFACAIVFKG